MLCCRRSFSWFGEASGFFLELLDLATSSATPESEEMEAVIQDKSEKRNFKKPPKLGEGTGVKGQAAKEKDPSLLIYSLFERVGSLLRGWRLLNQSKQQHRQAKILLS